MTMVIVPQLNLGVDYPVQFDFTSLLAVGETVSGATCTAIVFAGTDSTPSTILNGSPTIVGSVATQIITSNANSEGVIYEVTCVVTTSATHVFSRAAKIAFVAPGGAFAGNGT